MEISLIEIRKADRKYLVRITSKEGENYHSEDLECKSYKAVLEILSDYEM